MNYPHKDNGEYLRETEREREREGERNEEKTDFHIRFVSPLPFSAVRELRKGREKRLLNCVLFDNCLHVPLFLMFRKHTWTTSWLRRTWEHSCLESKVNSLSSRKHVKLAKIRFWESHDRCKLSPYCLLSSVCLFICFLLSFTVHCF